MIPFIVGATLVLTPQNTRITPSLLYHWQTHLTEEAEVIVNILDSKVLNILENSGYSLSETLGAKKASSNTKILFQKNTYYRDFANSVGKNIPHSTKTDQLPKVIPLQQGDIPEMVRLIRKFEDKGKRSRKDLKAGYYISQLSNNSQHPYSVESDGDEPRHFDYRWLYSPYGYFKLIAVVNRIDKIDFDKNSCGEVRFIYRLSYRSKSGGSTLPFFLNVVHQYPKNGSCKKFAVKWLASAKLSKQLRSLGNKATQHFAKFLIEGALRKLTFKQLETNYQSLRFTSGYMHDFGGQAMYFQRVFKISKGHLAPTSLENTPNVLAIEKNPVLLKQFIAFLALDNNLKKLDQGTLVINFNEKFLAKRSVSWSTLGRARTANKPYRRLFANKQHLLNTVDISKLTYIKSYAGLIERLDNMTCMGCHQSSGTAGFHMLGFADNKYSHGFNKQELPYSPHTYAESARRKAYVRQIALGKIANKFRPHSNFSRAKWTATSAIPKFDPLTIRSMCTISKNHFSASPSCKPHKGLKTVCHATVTNKGTAVLFGECILSEQKNHRNLFAGGACWQGQIIENSNLPTDRGPIPTYNYFAFRDKWRLIGALHANRGTGHKRQRYGCGLPKAGAPLGRRSRSCTVAEENFTVLDHLTVKSSHVKGTPSPSSASTIFKNNQIPNELCANQGGNGFDLCAATGNSGACLKTRVARAVLDTCYPGNFCREDYICQKFPNYHLIKPSDYWRKRRGKRVNQSSPAKISGATIAKIRQQKIGFCVPTYFLFNMRVDGHPSPTTGLAPGKPKINKSRPLRGYKK